MLPQGSQTQSHPLCLDPSHLSLGLLKHPEWSLCFWSYIWSFLCSMLLPAFLIKNGHLPTSLLPTEESSAALARHTGPFRIWFLSISLVSSLTTYLLHTSWSSLPYWIIYISCHIPCCSSWQNWTLLTV